MSTSMRETSFLYVSFIPRSSYAFKEKRSLPARQLLVGYWGQNAIGTRVIRQYWEKDLRYFCNNHKFDVYLVAFVHRLFRNNRNRGITMYLFKVNSFNSDKIASLPTM